MSRKAIIVLVSTIFFLPWSLLAEDEAPPISITSPDAASTFATGTIKAHTLFWDKRAKMLIARVTFTDAEQNIGQPNDDTHDFRLPGVHLDEVKGIFFATSRKGESIPVAHYKKVLFIKSIETMPNAVVRVLHPRGGNVTVILEAISPDDPAMRTPPSSDPDATHKVDIDKILN